MPIYRLRRHVVYDSACARTREVWGVDRPFGVACLPTVRGPRDTDADDPLRVGDCGCGCPLLLRMPGGDDYVPWDGLWTWLSAAEDAGYELVSGYKKLSPYSVMVLRGP